jgi:hypothetical protein
VAAELGLAAIADGLLALLAGALIDPGGQPTHIDLAAVTVGMLAGIGLDRLLRADAATLLLGGWWTSHEDKP